MRRTQLETRLRKLEAANGVTATLYEMPDGQNLSIPQSKVLEASCDACYGENTAHGFIMRNAVWTSDGSMLHQLVRAIDGNTGNEASRGNLPVPGGAPRESSSSDTRKVR